MSKHGPHQHDGIWRIEPCPKEDVDKVWGLYKNGNEVGNRREEDVGDLIICGPRWCRENDGRSYKNTESVYLLLPWEFML